MKSLTWNKHKTKQQKHIDSQRIQLLLLDLEVERFEMNEILQHIDSFSKLSPILPPILKAGLIVLVCLVAYLLLSLLAWVCRFLVRQFPY